MAKRSSSKRTNLLGAERRRVQPKLRMVANGNAAVNTLRAELAAAVKVDAPKLLRDTRRCRGLGAEPVSRAAAEAMRQPNKAAKRGKLKKLPKEVKASVFIYKTTPDKLDTAAVHEAGRKGRVSKATVSLAELRRLAENPHVAFIELGQPLRAPTPIVTQSGPAVPAPERRSTNKFKARHRDGENVLIGIIDVQGFDFSHPDFLDERGRTRWVSIWDQGGDARPAPDPLGGQFDYGAEFSQEVLRGAMQAAKSLNVPAYDLEPQNQRVPGSHGTHVASIAAGQRGVCPKAMLAGVLIDLPKADEDRRKSFYDSTRIADAVDYLVELQRKINTNRSAKDKVSLSINISLGTNGHAHDASSAVNRWLDAVLNEPGRCITVAAGNAGQSRVDSMSEDYGWLLGQIHTQGRIDKAGLMADIEWVVVGNGVLDISENELEIWYSPQDRFAVQIKPPGGDWLEPIEPRQFIENRQLPDGSFLSVYNELYHPANGANYIAVYLSPMLSEQSVIGVPAGTWQIRLIGREIRDGRFHAWIERDDPVEIGPVGPKNAWRFPSFFSDKSNVDSSSVSSLACAERIVAVANLDGPRERISISSSQGPTRDGRLKPDISADGTDVIAANGFAGPDSLWIAMSGTSMAAPYVAGAAGLMLAAEPRLTGAQILGILQRTARPLPGSDYNWRNDSGFGRISLEGCIEEAVEINAREDETGE
jgi:subtilisin family serine protease